MISTQAVTAPRPSKSQQVNTACRAAKIAERFSLADEGEGEVLRLGHEGARKVSMLTRAPWVVVISLV